MSTSFLCEIYYILLATGVTTIVYHNNTLYRAECKITFEGECVVSETDIYKLDNYRDGNRVWLWFNGVDWEQGPGENYFDIEDVMHK